MTAKTPSKKNSLTNDPEGGGGVGGNLYLASSCTEDATWVKDQRQTLRSENALGKPEEIS